MLEILPKEQLILIIGSIVATIVVVYLGYYILRLERKCDLKCFFIGDVIFMIFMLLLLLSEPNQVPNLLSSLFIAELTLALVWVELSKRPELKLLDFIPIIYHKQKAGIYTSEPSKPSRFLKIREVSHDKLKFNAQFGFAVDLANIGYAEIMVHEYLLNVDGERRSPIPLSSGAPAERLRMATQQRHPIHIAPLHIERSGFHKVKLEVLATTFKCSKEIWFFISEDFQRLRYVEMNPYKKLLSPIVKNEFKDP